MYTRCPKCSTIFRVTAAQLRVALGEVSCGACHQTFNALTALTEELPELTDAVVLEPIATPPDDPFAASPDTDATDEHRIDTGFPEEDASVETWGEGAKDWTDDTPPANETVAEPALDADAGYDEQFADADLEEPGDEPADAWTQILADVDGTAASDHADLQLEADMERSARPMKDGEPAYDDDTGIEEILAEPEFSVDIDDGADSRPDGDELAFDAPEAPAESSDVAPLSALETETADQEEWARFLSELSPADESGTDEDEDIGPVVVLGSADELTPVADVDTDVEPDGHEQDEEAVAETHIMPGGDEAEPLPESLIDYDPQFVPPWESESTADDEHHRRAKVSGSAVAIAAALLLALGVQLIHYNRDALAAHSSWGPRIRAVYGMLGSRLYPKWSLDAYRVSGSEAVAGRTAPAALDILASVVVAGDEEVGMPMIRVALRDRWSNPVASRVFSPAEYLRDFATRPTLLAPGTTLPVEISVADPGTEAHGYIVDVCLPHRTAGLQCQLEKDPFEQ